MQKEKISHQSLHQLVAIQICRMSLPSLLIEAGKQASVTNWTLPERFGRRLIILQYWILLSLFAESQGPAAVSLPTEALLKEAFGTSAVERLAGPDRYATAAAIAERENIYRDFTLATAEDFPDALTAGTLASWGPPLLLTRTDSLPDVTRNAIEAERRTIADWYVVGGDGAVSPGVREQVAQALE